ncbi:MAG: PhoX family phosphatase [Burkholderiaceae bacterium]|nr:PhoX family phosphatase [Burkholderiaceae bacterium]
MGTTIRDDDGVVNTSGNRHLNDLVDAAAAQSPARRDLLKSGFGLASLSFLGLGTAACGSDGDSTPVADPLKGVISFKAVGASSADTFVVPEGYTAQVLYRWGDPIYTSALAFKGDASEGSLDQEGQAGDNHDGMHFFALKNADGSARSDAGILAINHEYINPEYFYAPGNDAANWLNPFTFEKAKKAQAGHGISIVEVRRKADSSWEYLRSSPYNRRITAYTTMQMTGPAAGNDLLKTAADPSGTRVLGTANNCANGFTPWGTYLTCEENFNGYFGWNGARTPNALENRYGIAQAGFGYRWHEVDPRWDVNATPNEPNCFGWVVEIDPYDPGSTPKKRTALGRFKHENAELVLAANGKVVVYMGCDERNEYIYKFVSTGSYDPKVPATGKDILDAGVLYVARFNAGASATDRLGDGEWIALIHGQNGLTAENGFANQAEILIKARMAADRVGATMMDRPEWIAANPTKLGEVYCTLTNNNRRGTTPASSNKADGTTVAGAARPAVDDANPRGNNVWGHIIRWNETGGDPTALKFAWDIFLLAGNPKKYPDRADLKSGSAAITLENQFNSPDGLAFDSEGRMWIQTDGNYTNSGEFDGQGNNQMLVADAKTGAVRRFLVGPSGCEVTGVTWTPDLKAMFVNIQHPGEMAGHPNQPKKADGTLYSDNDIARDAARFSRWPDGAAAGRPRAATVVIRKNDGGVIGT